MLTLISCTPGTSDVKTPIRKSDLSLKGMTAGDFLNISVEAVDDRLLKTTKVEVTLDDAVKHLMEEAFITSAKSEYPIKWENRRTAISVPTTTDFRPGIWHIPLLRFFDPSQKRWIELQEGTDFAGTPLLLTNSTKFVTDKPKVHVTEIKSEPAAP